MKIIIYSPISPGHGTPKTAGHTFVSSISTLRSLIAVYPNDDIEGEIWPEAIELPDFKEIMHEIYEHKYRLYQRKKALGKKVTPAIHIRFCENVMRKFPNMYTP